MKICIPTTSDKGLDDYVNDHFGSSPFYTLINTDSNDVEILSNLDDKTHGSCSPASLLAEKGTNVMICKGMGRRAISFFSQSNIEVYICDNGKVSNIVDMYKNNQLRKMNLDDGCQGHH
jgi:predicted Fe-Mo cluster-binding NifX family protein